MTDIVEQLRIDRWTPREESHWRIIAKKAATEIEQLRARGAPCTEAAEEIARLRTAIFNTINDLDKKKPNTGAIRRYLANVYNARPLTSGERHD
jgi:hypothetical protein